MSTSTRTKQPQATSGGSGAVLQAARGLEQAVADPITDRPGRYIHAPAPSAPDVPTVPRGHGAPIVHDPRLDEASARLARLTVHVSETARQVRRGYSPYALPSSAQDRSPRRLARWRATLAALTRRARALLRGKVRAGSPDRRVQEPAHPHPNRQRPRLRRSGAPRVL